ncbi:MULTISPECIES: hypothetical protein [Leptolyngbya]|nr:hypothetical protein [Leptolyngbya sp. FACHB-1624]
MTLNFLIVDTETTGLAFAKGHELVPDEFAVIVRLQFGHLPVNIE